MISTTGKPVEQVVNEIFKALCEQGEPCKRSNGVCSYGNTKGQHCAVGMLLDENDAGIMQSRDSVKDLPKHFDLGENRGFIIENEGILMECQCIHDADNEISMNAYRDHLAIRLGGITPEYVDRWVCMHLQLWSEDQC